MSKIGDLLKRILRLPFGRNNIYKLGAATNDLMLSSNSNSQNMEGFENKLTEYLRVCRNSSYNITLDSLRNIISEYKPGTVEMLYEQGRLTDLFSYDTFLKYRKEESFDDRLKLDRINSEELFEQVTRRQQVVTTREAFNSNFMLYYNLKKNDKEAFNLLCYTEIDMFAGLYAGVAEKVRLNDLEKLNKNGRFFRLNDLMYLASKVTPEQYEEIVQSGRIEELYSSKYCENVGEIENLKKNLEQIGVSIDEQTLNSNFRLIQYLMLRTPDIFLKKGIEKYSFPEIFGAATKLNDAKFRIRDGKKSDFVYETQTIIDLLEYERSIKIPENISEEDMLNMAENFARNQNFQNNPRYIEYSTKRNRPYQAQNIQEIINYKEFCADQILKNPNIDLKSAKRKFLNALFSIDVPQEQRERFEIEMLEQLYFHQKYLPNSMLETTYKPVMNVIRNLFEATNIEDFKNLLSQNKVYINNFNTERIGFLMQRDLSEFSRADMVEKLQETHKKILQMPYQTVFSTNGIPVNAKVLKGEEFYIATSTAMPKCSGRSHKILMDNLSDPNKARREIYTEMLNTPMTPREICTSIMSDNMIGHAGSAISEQELIFMYIPDMSKDISIVGMHDLSTIKNKDGERVTEVPTTPRGIEDFVLGTTEEHNEAVMSNVYPRYIVCFDKITDIAIAKKNALEQEYKTKGINQSIEILFIEGKETYIPKIKRNVEQEHLQIRQKLKNGQFTTEDFSKMFERKESNFALRTLQLLHSTSYRKDSWNETYNRDILNSMIDIIESVSKIVPPEKARSVEKVVSTLIDRSNSSNGSRFYDQTYAFLMDTSKLEKIRTDLMHNIVPYEMCQRTAKSSKVIAKGYEQDVK